MTGGPGTELCEGRLALSRFPGRYSAGRPVMRELILIRNM